MVGCWLMRSLEPLKLLAAKSITFDALPGGGVPQLLPSDVSAALAYGRISEAASLFARLKYTGEDTPRNRSRLQALMCIDLLPEVIRHKSWEGLDLEFIGLILSTALSEALSSSVCRTCGGRGHITVDDQMTPCAPCDASGIKSFSKREVARRLKLDARNYTRRYEQKYRQLLGLFYDLEGETAIALGKIG